MKIRILLLLIITMMLSTGIAFAKAETFDIATFQAPAGWKKATGNGVVSYTKTKGNGYCIIAVYASRPNTGNIDEDFKQEWNDLVVQAFGVSDEPKVNKESQDGWNVAVGIAQASSEQTGDYRVVLSTFSGYGKVTSILMNYNDDSFRKDIDNFLNNFDLAKGNTTSNNQSISPNKNTATQSANVKPSGNLKGNSVVGVWMGYEEGGFALSSTYSYATNTFTYSNGYKANKLELKWKVFLADGTYYEGIPPNGIHDPQFDPNNDNLGRYTVSKGMLTAKLNKYPKNDRLFVIVGSNSLKYVNKFPFIKCKSVDGLKLDGTFRNADPMSGMYYQSLGKPMPTITFTRGGQFSDDNFIGDYNEGNPAGNGTYQIQDFTLILSYDDGRVVSRLLTVFSDKDPNKSLYIGTNEVKRQ